MINIGPYEVGPGEPLLLIAGPCVIEDWDAVMCPVALELERINRRLDVNVVLKSSFDKANRTRWDAERGPGFEEGLRVLKKLRGEFGLPICTDFHEPWQFKQLVVTDGWFSKYREMVDLVQIPAMLCRQTDLLNEAARFGKPVFVKRNPALRAAEMQHVVEKLKHFGCDNALLGERGTAVGGDLMFDPRSLIWMRRYAPVVFDATHAIARPPEHEATCFGTPRMDGGPHPRGFVYPMALAAAATGIDGLFIETHPDPDNAKSDGPNMLPLEELSCLIDDVVKIRKVLEK